MRWATYASTATALTLITLKLLAWWMTDSLALLSSLVDSLLDGTASVMMLLAVRHSLVPADREHRFGHGKVEALAALGQACLISGSALFLVFEALRRLFAPAPVSHGELGLAVMAVSLVATFALTRFQNYVVRRTGSVAIRSDALHYLSDLLMNAAVILALVLTSQLGWTLADPLLGLAIAAFIVRGAWRIGVDAYNMLMDRELPDDERRRIVELVRQHSEVLGVHDLKTRTSGRTTFIQLHLEIDGGMTLYRAHAIAEAVEAELQTAFPNAEVTIHQDPHVLSEETPVYS
ncbi:cation diffusion facilitator family transporter [Tistlia consotensis]|nr:cation diffusion facilitator family transporter [Tistlia consotensis]